MEGTTSQGWWVYATIVLGIIVFAAILGFSDTAFETIGNFFNDGISGDNTDPNGWGTTTP